MKKLLPIIALAGLALAAVTAACNSDEQTTWDKYADWRELNNAWLADMQTKTNADGTPYYKVIIPDWNPATFVLIHYFNDRAKTEGNLSPLVTSTVDAKYIGRLYNDEPFDSSFTMTTYGDSIYRFRPSDMISGWQIALTDMRVGDSCRVVIPADQGYGVQSTGIILPYSVLVFDIKLTDIYSLQQP